MTFDGAGLFAGTLAELVLDVAVPAELEHLVTGDLGVIGGEVAADAAFEVQLVAGIVRQQNAVGGDLTLVARQLPLSTHLLGLRPRGYQAPRPDPGRMVVPAAYSILPPLGRTRP